MTEEKIDKWDIVRKNKSQEKIFRKLSYGVHCFKILSIKQPKQIVNKYDRIYSKNKSEYMESIYKEKDAVSKYNVYEVGVKVWHWSSKLAADGTKKLDGMMINTQMTVPILQLMRSHLDVFIEHKMPEPELILYWKANKLTVKYAFIYEKDWKMYKDIITGQMYDVIAREFYWLGRKEYYDEKEMLRWYK